MDGTVEMMSDRQSLPERGDIAKKRQGLPTEQTVTEYLEAFEYRVELTSVTGLHRHIDVRRSNAEAVLKAEFEDDPRLVRAVIQRRPKPQSWVDLMSSVRGRRL